MAIALKIENQDTVLAQASGNQEVTLIYAPEYVPGDQLVVECDSPGEYLIVQLEDSLAPTFVFLAGGRYAFPVPFGEKRVCYSPRSFTGEQHMLQVRKATPDEIAVRKNLALNPLDGHGNHSLFPHASANVETRGESVFAARNAVDGFKANHDHGPWPFQSWGINQNPQAELKVDFGREVLADEVVLYLRADFPHDAWWEQATLDFSDGSTLTVSLEKLAGGQSVPFATKKITWVVLHKLIKADDPSPFPALTQIEIYGTELE